MVCTAQLRRNQSTISSMSRSTTVSTSCFTKLHCTQAGPTPPQRKAKGCSTSRSRWLKNLPTLRFVKRSCGKVWTTSSTPEQSRTSRFHLKLQTNTSQTRNIVDRDETPSSFKPRWITHNGPSQNGLSQTKQVPASITRSFRADCSHILTITSERIQPGRMDFTATLEAHEAPLLETILLLCPRAFFPNIIHTARTCRTKTRVVWVHSTLPSCQHRLSTKQSRQLSEKKRIAPAPCMTPRP